ncbi:MAG: hypothetical protein EOM87_00130 [Clostridia bacterium]|nr:hypothetical protein [Clostridia bacterium]
MDGGDMKNKIIALIVALLLLCTALTVFVGCNPNEGETKNKKVMLLLHGIGEGCLYNTETNQPVYSVTDFNGPELGTLLAGITSTNPDTSLLKLLAVNEDGSLRDDDVIRPANMDDTTGQYVMANLMKPLYDMLSAASYSDGYDIVIWQYDWRKHTDDIAADLEAYIHSKGYEKVMLFTHSMGGLVSSSFFKKQANRDMTELFIPFSTPFYGAVDTTYMMYEGLIASIPEMIDKFYVSVPEEFSSLISALGLKSADYCDGKPNPSVMYNKLMKMANNPIIKSFIDINSVLGILKDLAKNLVSLYNLYPSEAYFESPLYAEGESNFNYDGDPKTYEEFLAIFETDPYLSEIVRMSNNELRPAFANLTAYQESLMPGGEQISNLVNTFYVQGNGVKTIKSAYAYSDGTPTTYDYFTYGDGLVSVWSGTAGLLRGDETPAQLAALSDKVYIANGENGRTGTSHLFIVFEEGVLNAVNTKVAATVAEIKG